VGRRCSTTHQHNFWDHDHLQLHPFWVCHFSLSPITLHLQFPTINVFASNGICSSVFLLSRIQINTFFRRYEMIEFTNQLLNFEENITSKADYIHVSVLVSPTRAHLLVVHVELGRRLEVSICNEVYPYFNASLIGISYMNLVLIFATSTSHWLRQLE